MFDKIFEENDFIRHIKEQLDKLNMSAMVGAGFSKNANKKRGCKIFSVKL
jgi:hypothetical protein